MEEYIIKDGKRLRLGYTTGSCAAAAAKAACFMLLTGRRKETVELLTPKGILLTLSVLEITQGPDFVSCAIRKDSGDDPDATRDTLIFASVRKTDAPGVFIDGGAGVGRVTKRGLDQPVGAAAINSVPRRMIEENVREVCPGEFTASSLVASVTGVDNVCERAAMVGAEQLLVSKTAMDGVTVAVALEHWEVHFG